MNPIGRRVARGRPELMFTIGVALLLVSVFSGGSEQRREIRRCKVTPHRHHEGPKNSSESFSTALFSGRKCQ